MESPRPADKIKVLLRVDTRDGQPFALLPEITHDARGLYCTCFNMIGSGAADYLGSMQNSRAAVGEECRYLIDLLESAGYERDTLRIMSRWTKPKGT